MSVEITAQTTLDQNGYVVDDDFSLEVTEYIIDDCIDTVNALTGGSIAAMTGEAESKTATVTRAEAPAVKTLITLVLREAKKTSLSNSNTTSGSTGGANSVTAGGYSASESSSVSTSISASQALNNSANTPLVDLFYRLIDKLTASLQQASPTKLPPIYIGTPSYP